MVLIFIALLLGIAFLVWLWRGPVNNFVGAMKDEGGSALEAYVVLFLLVGGLGFAVYLLGQIV